MIRALCMWLSRFLPMVKLGDNGDYLHRFFIIRSKWFNVVLHRFLRSDGDQELHNHMWPGFSIILVGSYREEKMTSNWNDDAWYSPVRTKVVRWFNVLKKDDFHRVDLLTPDVWTLFFYGPKVRDDWGFIDRNTLKYTGQESFRLCRDGVAPTNID